MYKIQNLFLVLWQLLTIIEFLNIGTKYLIISKVRSKTIHDEISLIRYKIYPSGNIGNKVLEGALRVKRIFFSWWMALVQRSRDKHSKQAVGLIPSGGTSPSQTCLNLSALFKIACLKKYLSLINKKQLYKHMWDKFLPPLLSWVNYFWRKSRNLHHFQVHINNINRIIIKWKINVGHETLYVWKNKSIIF